MKLELGNVPIRDIQFGVESKIVGDVLYINRKELQDMLAADQALKSVALELAKPGDRTRIMPVKDVIEPRVKVRGNGGVFPGAVSKVSLVGSGRTNVLKGAAVVTTGKVVGFQEGLIDMAGAGAEYTPFSKLNNLVLVCEPAEGINQYEHEKALRLAGLKTATYLGELAKEIESKDVAVYQTYGMKEGIEKFPDLKRVGYVLMLQSQGLMHDTYVYGVDMKQSLTTIINPTEIMDGAIVSGNCVSACDKNTTYHHQNNPVIADLFKEQGKNLNFVCVIITNETVYLADKERSSDWTAKLANLLDLDGVIISQEGFGNPDTDLIMNCKKLEGYGIDTVIITDEYAGRDGASQSLADGDPKADAVITSGNANELIQLEPMDKVIGHARAADMISGGFDGSLKGNGSILVELQAITGATNELGFNKLSAR